jgi:hypothetical protein
VIKIGYYYFVYLLLIFFISAVIGLSSYGGEGGLNPSLDTRRSLADVAG